MPTQTTIHHTSSIERRFSAPPERVFTALSDTAQKVLWFATGGATDVERYESDFRVGGAEVYRTRFREGTPFPGVELARDGFYLDIVQDRRIVIASSMALGGRRISASLETYELLPAGSGCDLLFTHQTAFFEGSDGPEIRAEGWRKLIDQLERAVAA